MEASNNAPRSSFEDYVEYSIYPVDWNLPIEQTKQQLIDLKTKCLTSISTYIIQYIFLFRYSNWNLVEHTSSLFLQGVLLLLFNLLASRKVNIKMLGQYWWDTLEFQRGRKMQMKVVFLESNLEMLRQKYPLIYEFWQKLYLIIWIYMIWKKVNYI